MDDNESHSIPTAQNPNRQTRYGSIIWIHFSLGSMLGPIAWTTKKIGSEFGSMDFMPEDLLNNLGSEFKFFNLGLIMVLGSFGLSPIQMGFY